MVKVEVTQRDCSAVALPCVLKDHDGHIWLITRDTTHEGHLVWTWVDSGGIGRSYCSYKPTHGAVEDMTKFRELYEQGKYTILNAKLVIE